MATTSRFVKWRRRKGRKWKIQARWFRSGGPSGLLSHARLSSNNSMRCMEIDVLLLQYLVKLMMYTTEISETKLLGMRRQRGSTTLFH